MADLRLATRWSELARTQAAWVADTLTKAHPGLEVELVPVTTTGDRDRISPVTSLTEMGAFVRAVQEAVLDGRADAAVHSCKDLPVQGPEGLVSVHPEREAPWDVLCGTAFEDLPHGARVGTGSPRREAQLTKLRPDLEIVGIRGNVDTRLGKAASGEVDAVVLAEAGLRRLGRLDAWATRFDIDQMVPAPAQGVLAVEAVEGSDAHRLLLAIDHAETRRAVTAERTVLALTHIGCRGALGALAALEGDQVRLSGFAEDSNGPRHGTVVADDPVTVAHQLCELLDLPIADEGSLS